MGTPALYRHLLDKHHKSRQHFVDTDFPAAPESIIDPNDDIDDLQDLGPVTWKRITKLPQLRDESGELNIFHDLIEPTDIQQGSIGDCYFLSSIAALAENPERIRAMFLSDEANDVGIYAAKMYKNGIEMVVIIDDLIPCKSGDNVAFARANGPELWVILLEKMWAKLHGCYDRIAGGLEYETIRDLSGAPGFFFRGIDATSFQKIYEFDQLGYLMSCSVGESYTQE